jgi:hypothetical protein
MLNQTLPVPKPKQRSSRNSNSSSNMGQGQSQSSLSGNSQNIHIPYPNGNNNGTAPLLAFSENYRTLAGPKKSLLELFTCHECNAAFTSEKDLSLHSKAHKPQPYKCSQCSRAYTRREKLTGKFHAFSSNVPSTDMEALNFILTFLFYRAYSLLPSRAEIHLWVLWERWGCQL